MAIKLERFEVKNQTRGRATVLARFDVNFGPFVLKGYELVRVDDKTFVGDPQHSFKGRDGEWKTFKYISYEGTRGEEIQKEIFALAREEMSRRGSRPPEPKRSNYRNDEDDLPF